MDGGGGEAGVASSPFLQYQFNKVLMSPARTHWGTCTRHGQKSGHRNGACARFLRNMAATRKCMAEIKQSKIERVLAYREQVPRSGRVIESFLGYSDYLLYINKCCWPCFSSMFVFQAWVIKCSIIKRVEIQYLHLKQSLFHHSRLHKRGIPSAAFDWGKAPYVALFGQFSPPMVISLSC